jgi:tripartite-type tricarboxylate transporter receptor subunit TctC
MAPRPAVFEMKAQPYPSRPITIVVALPAGGAVGI